MILLVEIYKRKAKKLYQKTVNKTEAEENRSNATSISNLYGYKWKKAKNVMNN